MNWIEAISKYGVFGRNKSDIKDSPISDSVGFSTIPNLREFELEKVRVDKMFPPVRIVSNPDLPEPFVVKSPFWFWMSVVSMKIAWRIFTGKHYRKHGVVIRIIFLNSNFKTGLYDAAIRHSNEK